MNDNPAATYARIIDRCFINAPFGLLRQGLLDVFISNRLRPEISLEGDCLWTAGEDEFQAVADSLRTAGLQCTLHAPFFDLAPGGLDPKILAVTREKLRRAFALSAIFQPRSIVCHLGYDDNKHSYKFEEWLRISEETWTGLLELARRSNTPVMFENTYETEPRVHQLLFERLQSSGPGFCLDVGHLTAYAGSSWQTWTDALLPRLRQIHLHDNRGRRDEHIAIGLGIFNFREFFDFLRSQRISPLITLEPHSESDLWLSLRNIEELKLFEGLE
ncbi:MAG: sugar phosphate isomerase/epimerase family protein [Desulfobulbaceae bacterium]|jgi:sugar phosphate isomerase/epimerase|nr:sugar phosphate isomerase/epimerase family protein [Desulfobulbaceae bacterium]